MSPIFLGVEVDMPEGTVGVDDYSRFEVVDGETCQIEFYPWPFRHPILALQFARNVLMWHVKMVWQHGWARWNNDRKY